MTFALLSSRPWNSETTARLNAKDLGPFILISDKSELTITKLMDQNIEKIFVAHWSSIIEPEVFNSFEVIIFHMTDLPFGRGGSPLQNLIVRGIKSTKITALRCTSVLDGGPIYLKEQLSLNGSAEEIYIRADLIIEKMIATILLVKPEPIEQVGEPVVFQRRKNSDSKIPRGLSGEKLYDFIRMLDAPGYPHAFLTIEQTNYIFTQATYIDGVLNARIEVVDSQKIE